MKRFVAMALVCALAVGIAQIKTAQAVPEFKKKFEEKYVESSKDEGLKEAAKKAGCTICHGKDKKVRNDYGKALSEILKKDNFKADRVKAEPDKVKKEIFEAFEKVEAKKNADGKTFGELIKAGKLPGKPVE